MVAVENKNQVVQEETTFKRGTEKNRGFYKTYNRSTPVQNDNNRQKKFSPAVLLLLSMLTVTTVYSFENPVFFEKLLACNIIISLVAIMKFTGYRKAK